MHKEQGKRYNQGKLRYDLLHPVAQEGIVKVLTFGSQKYDDRNWEKGMSWSSIIASLKRHLAAIEKGEDYDEESGLLHIDHVQCNAHFLSAHYKIAPHYDDRRVKSTPKIGLDIDGVLADFVGAYFSKIGMYGYVPTHWNDPHVVSKFDLVKNDEKFWSSIPRMISPKDVPFEPHCYITSRPVKAEITEDWLLENGFPKAKVYSIGHDVSKIDTAKESGIDIFVDDRYDNFKELNDNGILCYLYDAPYNREYDVGHKRIKSLKELSFLW